MKNFKLRGMKTIPSSFGYQQNKAKQNKEIFKNNTKKYIEIRNEVTC